MESNDAPELPDHVLTNRAHWDGMAKLWIPAAKRAWSAQEPYWGVWGLPESDLGLLPADMSGLDTIELGCGTGYVSGWMVRRGARAVGIDNSARQLDTARELSGEHGVAIELLHGNAESVPYPDSSFDFAISEYGAAIWCDPRSWIPEAHRLLRPGGELVFLATTPLATITMPLDGSMSERYLHRDYFGMYKLDWTQAEVDPGGVEFIPPISEWVALFRRTGFEILDYLELRAPASMEGTPFQSPAEWGKRWPYEHVWKVRRRP